MSPAGSSPAVAPPLAALERALIPAAALRTAVATGLLDVIASCGERPCGSDAAADRTGLDPHRTSVLLEVLADAGLVERCPDGYRVHRDVGWLGTLLESMLEALPAAVAREPPAAGPRRGLYPKVVRSLGERIAPTAERVAAHLAAPGAHVLDLGAGAAPWSLGVLAREPTARLTAVDRAEVLPQTRAAVEAAGATDRVALVAADLTRDPLPGPADVVILAHVCHLFDEGEARAIVRRAAASVAQGGCLALIDFGEDPAHEGDRAALRRYELGLFARTGTGRVHALAALEGWCREAGLQRIAVHRLDVPSMVLLVARAVDAVRGRDDIPFVVDEPDADASGAGALSHIEFTAPMSGEEIASLVDDLMDRLRPAPGEWVTSKGWDECKYERPFTRWWSANGAPGGR